MNKLKKTFLVITSIADQNHPILNKFAKESLSNDVSLIIIGDVSSPKDFILNGCDFYSTERQQSLNFKLVNGLPIKHYARKNLGYLLAMSKGAEIIIETDDDNLPMQAFWHDRSIYSEAHLLNNHGWINVYKYFTDVNIWPRGFPLENIQDKIPKLTKKVTVSCPIQQGLADDNPDVDAIYRLVLPLPILFNKSNNIAIGSGSFCPFNSQNTSWFKEAFPLLYLPSFCSFRMTDIWRSFVAQRIAWTCNWPILFHQSTVRQDRNDHNLMKDFQDEIVGYNYNAKIYHSFKNLNLKDGRDSIPFNMRLCYENLIELGLIDRKEISLLDAWLSDVGRFIKG